MKFSYFFKDAKIYVNIYYLYQNKKKGKIKMINAQTIEYIQNKIKTLKWKPLNDLEAKIIQENILLSSKLKNGYSFYINEKKDKEIKKEDILYFDGETYQRIMRTYIFFLENDGIFIDEKCSYYIFNYDKKVNPNEVKEEKWILNKKNIEHWITHKQISDIVSIIDYLENIFNDSEINRIWNGEISLKKKYNSLSVEEKNKRENKSINARLNNKLYEDEYTHMFIATVDWNENSSYYAKIWGDERDEVISYFKAMEFDRDSILEER